VAPKANPNPALVGTTVTFTCTASDPEGAPIVYLWNYGDGTSDNLGSHIYSIPNMYNVKVTASDGALATQNSSLQITINDVAGPPLLFISQITATPNPASVKDSISFSCAFSPGDAVASWNFGDGSPELPGTMVSHAFTVAGTFDVTVTLTRALSQPVTAKVAVVINARPLSDVDNDNDPDGSDNDDDNDGIMDQTELAIGTNPHDAASKPGGTADADGDGIPDDIDPDDDNDGLTDVAEMAAGTSPFNAASKIGGIADFDNDGTPDDLDSDDDNDGFSDQVEVVAGVSAFNSDSVPDVNAAPSDINALTISKMSIKLQFATGTKDAILLNGTLPIPNGFTSLGSKVLINVGGIIRNFVLNAKGKAKQGPDNFAVTFKTKKGVTLEQLGKYKVSLSHGSFAADLASLGLSGDATVKDKRIDVPVVLQFGAVTFQKTQLMSFSAKERKSGAAKIPR
jgi:hypothetical protein